MPSVCEGGRAAHPTDRCAFEKSDAQERWGSENVFDVAHGGRSLRYTAISIYGSQPMEQEESDEHQQAQRDSRKASRVWCEDEWYTDDEDENDHRYRCALLHTI
jgi:hypothetical protein